MRKDLYVRRGRVSTLYTVISEPAIRERGESVTQVVRRELKSKAPGEYGVNRESASLAGSMHAAAADRVQVALLLLLLLPIQGKDDLCKIPHF